MAFQKSIVTLTGLVCCMPLYTASGQVLARSTFDSGTEGWTVISNNGGCGLGALATPQIFVWQATGGNPGGYFFRSAETPGVTTSFFRAPAAYQGDLSAALGGLLAFDLKQSATNSQFDNPDVILIGGGLMLFFDTPRNPGTTWTHYDVPLRVGAGWHVGGCTTAASELDLQAALASVTELWIRGEFRSGSDTCGLDNVILTVCAPDFNADGFLAFEDFDAFVSGFEAGSVATDFNHDGFLTFEDFDAFVSAFEAGC